MRKITFFKMMLVAIALVIGNVNLNAQFNIIAGSTNYSQDFNSLTTAGTWSDNTTLTGWYARTDATATISTFALNTGSTTTAGLYSFGSTSATDRALGFTPSNSYTGASGTGKGYLGWRLKNNTGSDISSIVITWTGEQWRKENNASAQSLNLNYQIGTTVTDLTTGTWTATTATFTSPIIGATTAAALDGNLVVNKTTGITITLNAAITNGSEIMLRWEDLNDSGSDHQLAIDDITVNATIASNPITATPTFSIPPNMYTTAQSVAITSSTDGTSIYYTTNGDDPTELSTLYTTPISVNTTTTIKAKAYKSGYDASSVATGTYTFPTSVASIADLRAATTPGFYKLTGEAVLTLKSTTRNAKYIQDATGAVLIDDNSGIITTAYNVGDGITGIIGTTALFNNMFQFTPVADPGVATSTGNTVTPAIVALADLINNQGKLVKVLSATITGTGNFVASTSYNLNGSASTVIRTQYADLDYVGQAIPTTAQDITGVVLVYGTTAQLVPRSLSDFTASLGTGLTPTRNTNTYHSNGNIILSASANQTVEIFNAIGQKLLSHKAVEGINTIPVSTKGLVLVKIGNQISKVIL